MKDKGLSHSFWEKLSGCPYTLPAWSFYIDKVSCKFRTNFEFFTILHQKFFKIFFAKSNIVARAVRKWISLVETMVSQQLQKMGSFWEEIDWSWWVTWILDLICTILYPELRHECVIAHIKYDLNSIFFTLWDYGKQQILGHLDIKIIKDELLPLWC